ncbi:hypothetical protein E2562_005415 [Oryza meyeriana var. granulata]|uniref:Protein kinase domain-containing protein n=1 Tax=Oryza meyeriana var. granulata TaxID=110450 RepID=A0A6G1DEU4_9ORYZ|nr:hypothetical protein E2562_005415 [Oryza meyeriana var. granulata]
MGNCWGCGARIKDGSPHTGASGMFSRSGAKDGSRLSGCSSRASSASMPPTGKTECEILQSDNVKIFSFTDLRIATRNFSPDSVLGKGGFGSVYKGWIDENTLSACKPGTGIAVAVKRLNQESLQGHREWLDYSAKLCDFGLAKDGPVDEKSHVSTRVMGTYGYGAPEYLSTGHLTAKSDVYSFGVVLLEMMSGRRAIDKNRPQGEHNLVEWARPYLTHKRKIFRVLDTRLEGQYSHVGAQTVATLALECLSYEAKMRPSMDAVVTILEELQESSNADRKPAAEKHRESTGTGKKAPTASAGKNSSKPRRKSLGETRERIGPNPRPLIRSH